MTAVRTKLKFLPGIAGAIGETGEQGPTGPVSIGDSALAFETRAAVSSATIDALVKSIYTAGYATAGDGGHGLYKRMLLAPADPTNVAYVRSVDRYTSAGVINSTNGGYWELVPQGGEVFIEQFGGKADWNGTTGTDNLGPLTDAIELTGLSTAFATIKYGLRIRFGAGKYRFSAMIALNKIVNIVGVGRYRDSQGQGLLTQFHFPNDTTCMTIHTETTGPGEDERPVGFTSEGRGSSIEGISFHGGGTDTTKSGIRMRGTALIRDCAFYDMPGTGIRIRASNSTMDEEEGNANNWRIENVLIHSAGLHGLSVYGNDANAGTCTGFETHECGGCGVLDESGLGNNYFGLNFAGYGNTGVTHGGRHYRLISNVGDAGKNTTPGTDNHTWYDVGTGGVTGQYPAWSGSTDYLLTLPFASFGNSNRSVVAGIYVEALTIIHMSTPGVCILGQCPATIYTNAIGGSTSYGMTTGAGIGGLQGWEDGSSGHTFNGDYTYAFVGRMASSDEHKGICVFSHARELDGSTEWSYRYNGNDLEYRQGTQKPVWLVTTPSTARTFGRAAAVPWMIEFQDIALVCRDNENKSRVMGMSEAIPSSGSHARGEIYFNADASASGFVGWVCTTGGTPGTWKTFGAISA